MVVPKGDDFLHLILLTIDCIQHRQKYNSPDIARTAPYANSRVLIHQPLGGTNGQATDIEIQAKRIVDFISGTVFAINGGLQKISPGTFLCTPNTVAIEGRITEEKESKKVEKPKAEKDEVEMDW